MRLIDLNDDAHVFCGEDGEYQKWNIDPSVTVDAVPVRHEKWKRWDVYEFGDTYECTACGEVFVFIKGTPSQNGYNYCPHCGARMGEVE